MNKKKIDYDIESIDLIEINFLSALTFVFRELKLIDSDRYIKKVYKGYNCTEIVTDKNEVYHVNKE